MDICSKLRTFASIITSTSLAATTVIYTCSTFLALPCCVALATNGLGTTSPPGFLLGVGGAPLLEVFVVVLLLLFESRRVVVLAVGDAVTVGVESTEIMKVGDPLKFSKKSVLKYSLAMALPKSYHLLYNKKVLKNSFNIP